MQTFRKLPKASPRKKIATARRGSTLAKCPVCLDLPIICRAGRRLLRYQRDGTSERVEVIGNKAEASPRDELSLPVAEPVPNFYSRRRCNSRRRARSWRYVPVAGRNPDRIADRA